MESPGFEPSDEREVRLRAGDNRREVKLKIAKFAETVQVGRDPRERASDRRGDAFATVLDQAQIDELPDDPDEMEQALRDMGGPGSVLRVNGFRGGRLPPKGQIQQIRFRRNMFAADAHEPGFVSIDITTKPGVDNWRGSTNLGFRSAALSARNAFAPVKGDEQFERYAFNVSGPLWKKHTSLSLSADGIDAFDTKTIVAALPSGYFADSIRRPNDSLNVTARFEHMLTHVADAARGAAAQPLQDRQSRRRRLRSDRARLQPGADRERAARVERRRDRQDDVQRAAAAVAV